MCGGVGLVKGVLPLGWLLLTVFERAGEYPRRQDPARPCRVQQNGLERVCVAVYHAT